MTQGLVLDIETKIDRLALAASGRGRAARGMPAALQVITALATLSFERDTLGRFRKFRLSGTQAIAEKEAAVIVAEQHLARVYAGGGELITFNGRHDLGVLRFALLRTRYLGGGGVARWIASPEGRHRDLMRELSDNDQWPRLGDVAAGLGFAGGSTLSATDEPERCKAELDVVKTMLLLIHLDAESSGKTALLIDGLLTLGRFIAADVGRRPHLGCILHSPLYASANKLLAGN